MDTSYSLGTVEWHKLESEPDTLCLYHRTLKHGAHYSLFAIRKVSDTEFKVLFRAEPIATLVSLSEAKLAAEHMAIVHNEPYERIANAFALLK